MPAKKNKRKTKRKIPRKIDLSPLKDALESVGKTARRALAEGDAMDPVDHVDDMRVAATLLQDAVEGFKREIKRRLLHDPRVKAGEKLPAKLVLRPGRPESSEDPDDYDLIVDKEALSRKRPN